MKLQVITWTNVSRHEDHECTSIIEPEDALKLNDLYKKYYDKDIFAIDSEEDREFILGFVNCGEYPDYCRFDTISFQKIEDNITLDDIRAMIVEKHNEQVEQTLTKLD